MRVRVGRGRWSKSGAIVPFHVMPMNSPQFAAQGETGLDLTSVLRTCLGCGIIAIDAHRRVTGFNPRAEALTLMKAGDVVGHSVDHLPAPLPKIAHETFSGRPIQDRQMLLHKENQSFAVQINSLPIGGESGKISAVVLVVNDISSVRGWESNMRRLDRVHSVGTLSASMAHEVKNAFVAVKTFVDILLEKNQQAELAGIVRQELSRIDSILRQMRKFSGPARSEMSVVRVHLLLGKALHLIQHLLTEKKIKVSRSFAASTDSVTGDNDQLEQAFINLFFNALDAMKPGGTLTVTTQAVPVGSRIPGLARRKGPWVRVTIQDDGMGIAPEVMARLFEPFFTTKPDGTGLGLAITRRIIQEHQGAISVESQPDKGAAFSLTLPVHGDGT